jgi:hypothetical protein
MPSTQPDVAPRVSEHAPGAGGGLAEAVRPRPGPAVPGDVVVRTLVNGAHRRYALSAVPGPDQCHYPTLPEASRAAREYASQRQVDVWTDDGAGPCARLARFRV